MPQNWTQETIQCVVAEKTDNTLTPTFKKLEAPMILNCSPAIQLPRQN